MDARAFIKQINEHTLLPFYLLHGEESYASEQMLRHAIATLQPQDEVGMDREFFAEGSQPAAWVQSAQTCPWLSPLRVVVVRGSGLWKIKAGSEAHKTLADYLENPNPQVVLLFVCPEKADARTAVYKMLQKNEVHSPLYTPGEAAQWLCRQAGVRGGEIQPRAATHMAERCGVGLWNLNHELDKLLAYAGGRAIGMADVDTLTEANIAYKVFAMVDCIVENKPQHVARLLQEAQSEREEPLMIMAMLARQLHGVYCVRTAPPAEQSGLAATLGVPPFALRRMQQQARQCQPENLAQGLTLLAELEERIKSGKIRDAWPALQNLIMAKLMG